MDDIGFIGHVESGGTLPLAIQCRNSSGVPTTPDSAPSYTVYGPSFGAAIASGTLGASDHDSKTGLRVGSLSISGSYSAGNLYTILYEYSISSSPRKAVGFFRVV